MIRGCRMLLSLTCLSLILPLAACNRGARTPDDREPTRPLEVVVFATVVNGTPTTLSPTVTPTSISPASATPTQVIVQPAADAPTATSTPASSPYDRPANINPLTGLAVDSPADLQRRPIHVRIGNDPTARPQVNLSQADVIYEEIVEWWITRLTAIYYSQAPDMVAPVRSARLINRELTQQYDAALVNSGGSDGVRWELSNYPIVNLDEYFHPEPYFYREGEPWQRRLAVNIALAHQYLVAESMEAPVALRGFVFDETAPAGGLAETVFIDYPSKDSKVLWRYNSREGVYERYVAGEPMVDASTDAILTAANVIIYFAVHEETDIVEDSTGATSVRIEMNGSGEAWVIRDGVVLKGIWRTDGQQTPEFLDAAGQPIPLKPGKSWIEVVPVDYDIILNGD